MTSLQPGELGKLIFIFTIAAHMTEIQDHITEWRGLVSVGLHTLVMMGAVVLSSGDTGMAIQYLMIAVIMLFSAGLYRKRADPVELCAQGLPENANPRAV